MTPLLRPSPDKPWESLPAALRSGELNGGAMPPLARDFGEEHPRASKLVEEIFERCEGGFAVRLWNGETTSFGFGAPSYTIVFNSAGALRKLALTQNPLTLADAYFRGDVDIEGDFYAALALRNQLNPTGVPFDQFISTAWRGFWLPSGDDKHGVNHGGNGSTGHLSAQKNAERSVESLDAAAHDGKHTREHNRRAIAFHYDVSNAFYELFLDNEMIYSCAYFQQEDDGLDVAQRAKLDHICRKLRLRPGEQFLDIGCGWGALAMWAARHYGVRATGITLSERQFEYAQDRIRSSGMEDRVNVILRDYRDVEGRAHFDKIASVGMFEHVGLKNLPVYFDTVRHLLKPGGLFLNHGITHEQEGWKSSISTRFINRYVFPDGELDTVSNVMREMERADFEIWDVEGLRPHYAKTLRHWVSRLEANHQEALKHVDESVYRTWRLYMAASALQFEEGDVGIYQLLASRRAPNWVPVPLTRRDIYPL